VEPKELQERRRAAGLDADSVMRAEPRIILLNQPLRHHEADGALTAESTCELAEDRQVDVQPNPVQSTDAKR
jgi:hypothetical protein